MTDRYETAHAAWLETVREAAEKATDAHQWAAALLSQGMWIDGPFRYVTATGRWLSTNGTVVLSETVSARRLAGPDLDAWTAALDAEPARDCSASGELATVADWKGTRDPETGDVPDVAATIGTKVYCYACESDGVPVVDDGNGAPVYEAHDVRGRVIELAW